MYLPSHVCNASTRARLESHDDDNNDLQDEVRNVIVGSCGMGARGAGRLSGIARAVQVHMKIGITNLETTLLRRVASCTINK